MGVETFVNLKVKRLRVIGVPVVNFAWAWHNQLEVYLVFVTPFW